MRLTHASVIIGRRRPGHGRPRRALPLIIASLVVMPLAASCQAAGTSSGSAGSTAISVAAIRGPDDAPLYIAVSNGAFKRAGLDVTIRSYSSASQELDALSNGSVDIAAADYVDFFYLMSQAKPPYLSIVADGYHAAPGVMEVLTYPGSGITTPQNLVGKTVGTSEPQGIPIKGSKPYSLETLATQSVLTNDLVNPSQITWKPMPTNDLIPQLASHKVAAILVEEPYILQAENTLGAIAVLDSCSGETANLPLSGYFATTAFVRAHQQALTEFRSVLKQAQTDAVLPGPLRDHLAHDPGMDMLSASLVTLGDYPTSLNAANLQRVASLMFNFEMFTQTLNVSSMVAH